MPLAIYKVYGILVASPFFFFFFLDIDIQEL